MAFDPESDKRLERLTAALEARGVEGAKFMASGLLTSVVRWAYQNVPSGELGQYAPQAISEGAGWHRDSQEVLDLLREAGYLDERHRFAALHVLYERRKNFIGWAFED